MNIEFVGFDGNNEIYGLYKNGQKVGWITVNFELCSIMGIIVKEVFRKKHYGTKLVRYIESLALQKGCITVHTNPINEESIGFFVKCGYWIGSDGCGMRVLNSIS